MTNKSYPEPQQTATESLGLCGRRILQLLLRHKFNWVGTARLARISLKYRAYLKEFRAKGYVIESKNILVNGQVRSFFQLTRSPNDPVSASPDVAGGVR
ncbi:MAG: hypothetical protein ABR866_10955 [Candidatus Korobacteraceae bacterium]